MKIVQSRVYFDLAMWSWLFLVLSFHISCDSPHDSLPTEKTVHSQESTPVPSTGLIVTKVQQEQECLENIRSLSSISSVEVLDSNHIKLVVDSNTVLNEETLIKWVMNFAKDWYGKQNCPIQKIHFSTAVGGDEYYQAKISRDDYDLFDHHKISLAEWVRRFEIQQLDTKTSLVKKLILARSNSENDVALDLINKLLELEPDNLDYLTIQANIFLDQGTYFEAITLYDFILEIKPDRRDVIYNLACARQNIGRFSESLKLYEKLLSLIKLPDSNPSVAKMEEQDILLHMVDAYLKNNQVKEADEILAKVSGDTEAYLVFKSNVLRSEGRSEEAINMLNQLIAKNPSSGLAFFNLTLLHLDQKDIEAARTSYASLNEADPQMAKELEFIKTLSDASTGPSTPVVHEPLTTSGPVEPVFPDENEVKKIEKIEEGDTGQTDAVPETGDKTITPQSQKDLIKTLDLPYKPVDMNETDETNGSTENQEDEEDQPKIDWSKIPFIASKTPVLKPVGDPKIVNL